MKTEPLQVKRSGDLCRALAHDDSRHSSKGEEKSHVGCGQSEL